MTRRFRVALTVIGLLASVTTAPVMDARQSGAAETAASVRRLSRAALEDKIRGGWAGQMLGVAFGAPTEFKYNGRRIEGDLPAWTPERVENAINQDDLYVEMTFAEVMDRKGLGATSAEYGEAFRQSKYQLWHANAAARRLLERGLKPPQTGHPKYNLHADDIDFQIESDFIGLMTPGLPQEANKYCDLVGRVMNHGDGLYGGMFVTGMYAAAFFETDVRKVVEAGLASLPAQSGYARIIRDVLDWSARHPDDWVKTWDLIQQKWDRDDPCSEGALRDFNIDAKLNGAYIALGLLYGKGDFSRTIEVATRSGQDSDCNPSNAAGILGTMIGYARIPDEWKRGIPPLADRKFAYTNYSLNDIVASTVARALKVVAAAGGSVSATEIAVPYQAPKPPALEQSDFGVPTSVVASTDPAWSRTGAWEAVPARDDPTRVVGHRASTAGAEATLRFSGTGVALVGKMSQDGGLADVDLDGQPAGQLDAYIVERTNDDALWHVTGLSPGPHTVRVVVRGAADPRSKGRAVTLERAIIFGPRRN
jgi:hypothetical protein